MFLNWQERDQTDHQALKEMYINSPEKYISNFLAQFEQEGRKPRVASYEELEQMSTADDINKVRSLLDDSRISQNSHYKNKNYRKVFKPEIGPPINMGSILEYASKPVLARSRLDDDDDSPYHLPSIQTNTNFSEFMRNQSNRVSTVAQPQCEPNFENQENQRQIEANSYLGIKSKYMSNRN